MVNKHSTLFILKVLEVGGKGSVALRETSVNKKEKKLFENNKCVKVFGFGYWKPEISKTSTPPPDTYIVIVVLPFPARWMGILLSKFPTKFEFRGGGGVWYGFFV